mmetsp:Transcript_31282/g.72962  ORF Transcript_31282/g.72962 Transcript_31282/m.72962 type:complete len:187 (+) Transcript_31282:86-646(+)
MGSRGSRHSVEGALDKGNVSLTWENSYNGGELNASVWLSNVEGCIRFPGLRTLRFPLKEVYFEIRWDAPKEILVKKEKAPTLESYDIIKLSAESAGDEKLRNALREVGGPVICRGSQCSRWNNIYPGLVNFDGRTRVSSYVTLETEVTIQYAPQSDSISLASESTLELTVRVNPDRRQRRQYASFD